MAKKNDVEIEQPLLDFELRPASGEETAPVASEPAAPELDQSEESATRELQLSGSGELLVQASRRKKNTAGRPPLYDQLLSRVADAVVHLAALSLGLVSMTFLGLQPQLDQWPGFASFLACFSFLYLSLPLAFWGQTPGMAWRGLRSRDQNDRPLTFGQTALRWLAAMLTAALIGLPLLLLLGRRSLADLISRSVTVWEPSST